VIKISVVIPTYDRPELLIETLNSIWDNTVQPFEVIVVDNGINSIDVSNIPNKVKYFKTIPNIGVSQARNFGASLAKGDYIAFLDDDDLYEKDVIETITNEIISLNPDIILLKIKSLETGLIIQEKSGKIHSNQWLKQEILIRNPGVVGSNTILKRGLFKSIYYDPYLITGEDKAIVLDCLILNHNLRIFRSNSSVMYRDSQSTPRQSQLGNVVKGKERFFVKYKKLLSFKSRLINKLKIVKLKAKKGLKKKNG
jgi:glycosyltransferase involved in cell wall biosynthesis